MLRHLICVLTASLLVCASAGQASADRIKKLSRQLSRSNSKKVRISAALSLAKSKDARAIRALSRALRGDRSATIRRVSAASLGQRLQDKLGKKPRREALAALTSASKRDRDSKVRASAKVALTKASLRGGQPKPGRRARGVLVGVKTPKRVSRRLPRKTARLMQETVNQVIRDKAPRTVKTAPKAGMPSRAKLRRARLAGYVVATSISKLKLVKHGRRVVVKCEVTMRLSPWAGAGEKWEASKSATVIGSGSVTSGKSRSAVSRSSLTCITAVATQVTANQVVPFLAAKAR